MDCLSMKKVDAGLGMSQKLKKKIAVLQEVDENALPPSNKPVPIKETTYAKKIRNIVAAEAVMIEQNRRLTGESLFSVENVAYSWKEALSVAQHKKKRGDHTNPGVPSSSSSSKGNVDASESHIRHSVSEPQSRRSSTIESNVSGKSMRPSLDSQTSSSSNKGGLDSHNIPTTFRRKTSYPHEEAMKIEKTHEEALKRSVEQVVAQLAQPLQPLSDALLRTIHDAIPTTTTQPNNSQQKPPRVRREAYDPVAALSSLQTAATITAASTTGTVSILDRVRTLQHSQKLRKSFEIIPSALIATSTLQEEDPTDDPLLSEGINDETISSSKPKPPTDQDKENNAPEEDAHLLSSSIPMATPGVSEHLQTVGEVKWENTPWGPMLVSVSEKIPDKPSTDKHTTNKEDKRKKTKSMDFTPLSELFPKKPPVVVVPVVEPPIMTAIQRNIAAVSSTNAAAAAAATSTVPNQALLNVTADKASAATGVVGTSSSSRKGKAQSEKVPSRVPPNRISRASFQLDFNMRDLTAMTEAQFNEMTNYDSSEGGNQTDDDQQQRRLEKQRQRELRASRSSLEAIPMMQSEDAIALRAGERAKRRSTVIMNRDQFIKDEEQAILDNFERKRLRQEEKKAQKEAEDRRRFWLQVVMLTKIQRFLTARVPVYLAEQAERQRRKVSAVKIARWYANRKNRREAHLKMLFLKNFRNTKPLWMNIAQRWKQKVSAKRIEAFLIAVRTLSSVRGFSPMYIKRFMSRLRMIQRTIRSFLVCKRARIEAMLRKWDAVELGFIKVMFAEAEARRKRGIIASTSVAGSMMKWQRSKPSTLAAAVAAAAAAELKARRDRARISKWSELESRIESYMEKADGKHHTQEIVKSYMVTDAVKRPIVEKWLRDLRKTQVTDRTETIRSRFAEMKVVPSYTRDDARKLLQGDERGVLEALTRKLALAVCPLEKRKVREAIPRKTLLFYRAVNFATIEGAVKKVHQDLRNEIRLRRLAFKEEFVDYDKSMKDK